LWGAGAARFGLWGRQFSVELFRNPGFLNNFPKKYWNLRQIPQDLRENQGFLNKSNLKNRMMYAFTLFPFFLKNR
jgi:hypothetical protein